MTGNEADGHLLVPRPVGLVPKSKVGGGVVGRFRRPGGVDWTVDGRGYVLTWTFTMKEMGPPGVSLRRATRPGMF